MPVRTKRRPQTTGSKRTATIRAHVTHELIRRYLKQHGLKLTDPRIEKVDAETVIIHNNPYYK